MLTQSTVGKTKRPVEWFGGFALQIGRDDKGTFGVWMLNGVPVWFVRAAKA